MGRATLSSARRPGSISGMGTGLRRCGRIFGVSICLRHLMKSAGWVCVGYQIDNNNMLLYNYGHGDLITHNARTISGGSADRKKKQQKQRGGLWCRSRRDALRAPPGPLARGMARQHHRCTGPASRCCARGRTARCRAGDGDPKRPATYTRNFAADSL